MTDSWCERYPMMVAKPSLMYSRLSGDACEVRIAKGLDAASVRRIADQLEDFANRLRTDTKTVYPTVKE